MIQLIAILTSLTCLPALLSVQQTQPYAYLQTKFRHRPQNLPLLPHPRRLLQRHALGPRQPLDALQDDDVVSLFQSYPYPYPYPVPLWSVWSWFGCPFFDARVLFCTTGPATTAAARRLCTRRLNGPVFPARWCRLGRMFWSVIEDWVHVRGWVGLVWGLIDRAVRRVLLWDRFRAGFVRFVAGWRELRQCFVSFCCLGVVQHHLRIEDSLGKVAIDIVLVILLNLNAMALW